jgi:hypothetical protein
MNRERNGKLLTRTGLAVLTGSQKWRKRPDGGVVTQRTANPLPHPDFRHSLHNSPFVPGIACRGADVPSANAQGMPSEGPRREGGSGASAPASPVANGDAPKTHPQVSSQ